MKIEMLDHTEIAEYNPVEAGLQELRRKYANVVVDVSTPKTLEDAKRVRAEIREPRYECEKIRKALKAPALAHAKLIDTEAARITAELLAIETPWDDAIKAEEIRKEAEKEAKAAAERARIVAITGRIADVRSYLTLAQSARTAARIEALRQKSTEVWQAYNFEDDFQEFGVEAQAAFDATFAAIDVLLEAKRADEAETARVKLEQEAAAKKIKADKEANEAAAAKLAEERAAFEAEKAAMKAAAAPIAPITLEELMTPPAAAEVEFSAAQSYMGIPIMPAAAVATISTVPADELVVTKGRFARPLYPRPTDSDILDAVAAHFGISDVTALTWLMSIDFKVLQAEFQGEPA